MTLQIGRIDTLEDVGADWGPLADASESIFATPEWMTLWYRHFGDGQELRAYTVRDEGRLVALLPLVLWRTRPPRVLRFVGHGPSDLMGPICAAADRPVAAAALEQALADGGWDVLLAERLPTSELLAGSLRGQELQREASPVLRIEGMSWDDYLAAKSSNFRQQVRRRERKLAKEHDLRFRLADDPDRLDADLEVLFALHEERWTTEGSGALAQRRAAFHHEFARVALDRGWLRLWLLELDGKPAAAWYGLRFAGRELYYQAGRDPDLERAAVGFVLLVHTVREAINDEMREYDFLRGGEGYKDRFTDDDTVVETWAAGRGPLGRATVAVAPRMRSLLVSRLRG
ncbi:MAG: GNAT family N-acetyltransferase [Thermoleophilaceae bacterium]|nr:GNAT family N-acetyltransferase [Thermoleophilaceae bacterium]